MLLSELSNFIRNHLHLKVGYILIIFSHLCLNDPFDFIDSDFLPLQNKWPIFVSFIRTEEYSECFTNRLL